MSYGPIQVFTAGIASAASTSSYIDLGKSMTDLALTYVTMTTGALLTVYGSNDAVTFLPVMERISTSSIQYQNVQIPTTTSGAWATFKAPSFRYLQFVASATVTGGASLTVLAKD